MHRIQCIEYNAYNTRIHSRQSIEYNNYIISIAIAARRNLAIFIERKKLGVEFFFWWRRPPLYEAQTDRLTGYPLYKLF